MLMLTSRRSRRQAGSDSTRLSPSMMRASIDVPAHKGTVLGSVRTAMAKAQEAASDSARNDGWHRETQASLQPAHDSGLMAVLPFEAFFNGVSRSEAAYKQRVAQQLRDQQYAQAAQRLAADIFNNVVARQTAGEIQEANARAQKAEAARAEAECAQAIQRLTADVFSSVLARQTAAEAQAAKSRAERADAARAEAEHKAAAAQAQLLAALAETQQLRSVAGQERARADRAEAALAESTADADGLRGYCNTLQVAADQKQSALKQQIASLQMQLEDSKCAHERALDKLSDCRGQVTSLMQQLKASRAREEAKTQEVVTLQADLQRCKTAMELITAQIDHELPEQQDTKALVTDLYAELCDTRDQLEKAKRIARVALEQADTRSAELAQAKERAADAPRAHAEREGELCAGLEHARGVMRGLVKVAVALAAEREQLYVWMGAQDEEIFALTNDLSASRADAKAHAAKASKLQAATYQIMRTVEAFAPDTSACSMQPTPEGFVQYRPAEPVQPTQANPVQHTQAEPMEHTQAGPKQQTPAEPTQHTQAGPKQHTPAESMQHTPAESMQDTPAKGTMQHTPAETKQLDVCSSRPAGASLELSACAKLDMCLSLP